MKNGSFSSKVAYFDGKSLLSIRMVPVNGKLTVLIDKVSFSEIVSPQISVAPAGFAIASASWDQTVLHFMFNLILDYHVVRFECGVCDAARDLTNIARLDHFCCCKY